MRRLFFAAALLLLSQAGFGQAVKDNAVIPVSITLNSILRLTVTSGGNIQFVVNNIDQYTNGIANSAQYTTQFVVSSSRDFDVTLGAEDPTFIGLETAGTMDLAFLRFTMAGTGGGVLPIGAQELTDLTAPITIVTNSAGGNLQYEIQWELGTGGSAGSLLVANLPADIYVTNVFLNLVPN